MIEELHRSSDLSISLHKIKHPPYRLADAHHAGFLLIQSCNQEYLSLMIAELLFVDDELATVETKRTGPCPSASRLIGRGRIDIGRAVGEDE